MKSKWVYVAFLAIVSLTAIAASKQSAKVSVVYREQANGQWQVFVWVPSRCPDIHAVHVQVKDDETQPIEVSCDK